MSDRVLNARRILLTFEQTAVYTLRGGLDTLLKNCVHSRVHRACADIRAPQRHVQPKCVRNQQDPRSNVRPSVFDGSCAQKDLDGQSLFEAWSYRSRQPRSAGRLRATRAVHSVCLGALAFEHEQLRPACECPGTIRHCCAHAVLPTESPAPRSAYLFGRAKVRKYALDSGKSDPVYIGTGLRPNGRRRRDALPFCNRRRLRLSH